MFWGLIMEPRKRYTQEVKKPFHISMASLDITNSDDEPSQIMCTYEGRNYLLCTLQQSSVLQCPLDLHFEEGTTVSFATNGKSHVHLTGFLTVDPDDGQDEQSDLDEEEDQFLIGGKKPRKSNDVQEEPSRKKMKTSLIEAEEEESDDSDIDLDKLMAEEDDDEEESGDEDDSLDEEGSEEEEDSDNDEGLDDEEDDVEEEEEEKVVVTNGLSKKSKKNKKEDPSTPTQTKQKPTLKQTPGPKAKKTENNVVEQKKKGKEEKTNKVNDAPTKKTLSGGVVVEDIRQGNGGLATNGKFVHVYYEGRLKTNNKVFDKTQQGAGFGFRLGSGEVIKGWDIGVSGMKVGGKRRITCPPHVAYGAKGSPPVIPPNSTLVFEVELKKVK